MMNNSTVTNIIKLVVGLIIASFAIKILLSLVGGLFYVAFKFGIPLLIAFFIVRWLTESRRSHNRRFY